MSIVGYSNREGALYQEKKQCQENPYSSLTIKTPEKLWEKRKM